jgi:hypothetical protein
MMIDQENIVYVGNYYGSFKHGFGIQSWPDGSKYEGNWVEGKVCGKGKFTDI